MRSVDPTDHARVVQLLDEAFAPGRFESELVTQLRAHGKAIQEWVVDDEHGIAGYICYSNAYRGREIIGHHLAPVAVRGDARRRGIGSSLIRESLTEIGDGRSPVFVLGDPKYYERFGFRRVDSPNCPFDPTNKHFMALRWTSHSPFTVGYEEEFHPLNEET